MKRLSIILAGSILLFSAMTEQARSGSSTATERPWAPGHVERLSGDIRRDVTGHAKACGNLPAATHYFSVSIDASGLRFHAQHFEDFACANRSTICRPNGCLHEVFVDDGRRQRLVFSIFARDMKLTNNGDVAGIEVFETGGVRSFVWNSRRFLPSNSRRSR
jgi:hypothetical protein